MICTYTMTEEQRQHLLQLAYSLTDELESGNLIAAKHDLRAIQNKIQIIEEESEVKNG